MRSHLPLLQRVNSILIIVALAFGLLLVASTDAASDQRSIGKCDADEVLAAQIVGCDPNTPACEIEDVDIECVERCGDGCVYDFPNPNGLKLIGSTEFIASGDRYITIKAKSITDEGSKSDVRATGSGSGQVTLQGTMTELEYEQTNGALDIDLTGKIRNTTGTAAGPVDIQGHNLRIGEVDTSVTDSGTGSGEDLTITAWTRDIVIHDRIITKGRGSAGDVTLKAAHDVKIEAGEGIIAQKVTTNAGSPGDIHIISEGLGDAPEINIARALLANATAGSTNGGSVTVETQQATGVTKDATILVSANIKTDSQSSDNQARQGGAVTLTGDTVALTTGEIFANGTGNGGTGGNITAIAKAGPPSKTTVMTLNRVTSRARDAGNLLVRADGGIEFKNLVQVTANSGPDGGGGDICVTSYEQESGCSEDPCGGYNCAYPLCYQDVEIGNHVRAHGYGSQGAGGNIAIEGVSILLPSSPVGLKEINADAKGVEPPTGASAGSILLRSATTASPIYAEIKLYRDDPNDPSDQHTVTSRDSASTGNAVVTTNSTIGGNFLPSHQVLTDPNEFVDCR